MMSLLALLLTFLDSKGILRNGMLFGYVIIALVLAVRYNYGNDYPVYYLEYQEMLRYPYNLQSILSGEYFRDPGWALLCFMFKPIGGFFTLIATISIFEIFAVYFIIKKYVKKKYYVFSTFVFLFTTNIFLSMCSMIRQMLVTCVFLAMWPLIEKKKYTALVCIVIFIMSFIHGSALILIPFVFWYYLPIKNGKIIAPLLLFLFIILWLNKDSVNSIFQSFMIIDNFQEYADSYIRLSKGSWKMSPLVIAKILPFFIYLYYIWKERNGHLIYLVCISVIPFMVQPFSEIVPDVARISSYFYPFAIITVPYIFNSIEKIVVRRILKFLFIALTLYNYWIFYKDPTFMTYYSEYHTIFEL